MTRLPAILLVLLCGCATVPVEPVARMREGEAMTQRQVTIGWCAPTEGPRPTHYVFRRYHGYGPDWILYDRRETTNTEIRIDDTPRDHKITVRSVANNVESPDSLPLYVSFAITGIKPVERNDTDAGTVIVGILVTFAT